MSLPFPASFQAICQGVLQTECEYTPLHYAAALGDPGVKVGSPEKTVRRIYVVSGAGGGGDELCEAMRGGDALVTGEVRHHVFTEACEQGFPVIEFSHYYSEIICCDILKDMIKSAFRDLKVIAAKSGCPYKTLEEL